MYAINCISPPIKPHGIQIYDMISNREIGFKKICPALLSRDYKDPKIVNNLTKGGQLRRLTPKECFRLQGFLNDEINLDGLSDTQKYKLAGNGQDVNMVSLIFKEMFLKNAIS